MKRPLLKILTIFLLAAALSGCTALTIVGVSRQALQKEKIKFSKTFDKDISYCYENTLKILDSWEVTIYEKKDRRYILALRFDAVFANCIDTTEAGIFFKEPAPNKTEIEVSSFNHNLSWLIGEKLSEYLENPNQPPPPIRSRKTSGYSKR